VLASVYPMAEMAHRIGGEHVDVQWLAEGGLRPEEVTATAADLKQRANRAEMVITSGPWDDWAVAELSKEAREARLVEPMRMPAGRTADARSYLWLDPVVVRELVEAARTRLSTIDANREAEYRGNARGYQAEVDAVDREFRQGLAGEKGRAVLAVRPVWGAMCARYGLELLAPVLPTEKRPFVTDEALEQADFKLLAQTAKAAGISVIFVDVDTPFAVRQQIE
jgi:ABC-type Zn uptake system ZnuABC Zn-binding protein ZnuA